MSLLPSTELLIKLFGELRSLLLTLFNFGFIHTLINQLGEVHIQSFTVAKVWVHPIAMQNHLRHALFYHLVVLGPDVIVVPDEQ